MRFSGPSKRIGMKPFGCHPAICTSGAARFIQGFSLAKQLLTWYRLLIFRASLPKKMKIQSQLLKAVCICPMRFLSPKKCMARCFLVKSTQGAARYLVPSVL